MQVGVSLQIAIQLKDFDKYLASLETNGSDEPLTLMLTAGSRRTMNMSMFLQLNFHFPSTSIQTVDRGAKAVNYPTTLSAQ